MYLPRPRRCVRCKDLDIPSQKILLIPSQTICQRCCGRLTRFVAILSATLIAQAPHIRVLHFEKSLIGKKQHTVFKKNFRFTLRQLRTLLLPWVFSRKLHPFTNICIWRNSPIGLPDGLSKNLLTLLKSTERKLFFSSRDPTM